jgi:predicted dehydrogenase
VAPRLQTSIPLVRASRVTGGEDEMSAMNRREFARTAIVGAGAMTSSPLYAATPDGASGGQPPGQGAKPSPLAPPDAQSADAKLPELHKKSGYAVVGLGKLAVEEVLPAFGKAEKSRPVALVSGHRDKALRLARTFGVDERSIYDYAGFDAIKGNDAVDIVYIILPNSMHAEYTVRALEAGKHVLCEKPMAVDSAECQRMIDAAKAARRHLMIAYRLHYEPYTQKVTELCASKALGRVKTVATTNGQTTKAPNIRLTRSLGGGPVQDTGIYCINAARYVTGEEPMSVSARAWQPKDNRDFREVPESVSFTLHYASGPIVHCDTSFGIGESRFLRVQCEKGYIDMDNAYAYRGQRLFVKKGSPDEGGAQIEEHVFAPVDHFAAEMDHFAECVQAGTSPRTPGEMGLADLRIIEAIEEATRTGRTVDVK